MTANDPKQSLRMYSTHKNLMLSNPNYTQEERIEIIKQMILIKLPQLNYMCLR